MEEERQQQGEGEDSNVWRPDIPVWASLLMEMANNSSPRNQTVENHRGGGGEYLESQLQEMLRRRGRRPVSVAQLLQGTRAGLTLAPAAHTNNADDHDAEDRERGRVIVVNPYNQIVAVPSSAVSASLPPVVSGSLSEYFIGPEFEALLENLTETDPNRYGTPPARRDAVEALADVKIQEPGLECSVCLDDFEVGNVVKQMPCNHRIHPECLLPWLELHSSCPVCRYQLPSAAEEDETMTDSVTNGGNGDGGSDGNRH